MNNFVIIDFFSLSENDVVCVREGYSLQKQIPKHKQERGLEIKSQILYWKSGFGICLVIDLSFIICRIK